jgi:hypothetical protein
MTAGLNRHNITLLCGTSQLVPMCAKKMMDDLIACLPSISLEL